jgi:hypothetical protein
MSSRISSFCSKRTLVRVQPSVSMIWARIQVARIATTSTMLANTTRARARAIPRG